MASSSNVSCNLVEEVFKYVDGVSDSADTARLVQLTTLLTSCICLLISLTLNTYITANIAYKKKIQVCYFSIFLLLLLAQTLYLCLLSFSLILSTLPGCLPSSPILAQVTAAAGPVTRSCLGIFACIVGALTIERFLSSTSASQLIRCCSNILAVVTAVSGPIVVVAFFLITSSGDQDPLQQEFWFGAEVCVYIICPLLVLTVFGTVNCCKVSMTSRLLPSYQIQAIKLNIGVTISTNVAMFVFLVQESLHLWQTQLQAKPFEATLVGNADLESAILSLGLAHNVCTSILSLTVTLIPILYCCICCTCCSGCCCPAINQLEQVRYTQVEKEIQ
eukprot:GFUD01012521.1.p1 GENE.GFUD01012521.1~~GFUD01012521.1.p1  ORF type:complete len:333 (-),score=102.02 GFUD01012521.1:700-1698(-)